VYHSSILRYSALDGEKRQVSSIPAKRYLWPSDSVEQALPQQGKLGAAKHRALDQVSRFWTCASTGPLTSGEREPCYHGVFVFEDAVDKVLQFGDLACLGGFYRCIQPFSLSLVYHRQKVLNQTIGRFGRSAGRSYESELLLLLVCERAFDHE
jgi:hypothetical protein